MSPGVQQLKHIVVLMMENRSFDHMFGYLKIPGIDGLKGDEFNPDTAGNPAPVMAAAEYQSQLQPDPGHHWEDVKLQIYGDVPGGPTMKGFVKAYYLKEQDVAHSREIMYCFDPARIPVLTTLASKFTLFNRWFSSLPGPTVPNRAFAHFGTSFGHTDMDIFYLNEKYPTIYERMLKCGRTAKIYYYDQKSGTIALAFLLKNQPQLFATFDQFQEDCKNGTLPDYSFLEPNYYDHDLPGGRAIAADQHPDHNVLAGDQFIATVYMSILNNEALWNSTALLINYDEHGGMYDHVEPPACPADEFTDPQTGFQFDRLGIRVPSVLVSPWAPAAVISDRTFDHASIPATVTKQFIGDYDARSPREKNADTFADLLNLPKARQDYIAFQSGGGMFGGAPLHPPQPGHTVIPILSAPASAAQPDRPISQLLFDQIVGMQKAERTLPVDRQTHIDITQITTEAQASDYVSKVTAALLRQ